MKKADFEPTTLADDKTDSSDKRQGVLRKQKKRAKNSKVTNSQKMRQNR